MIFQNVECQMCCTTRKNHQKLQENDENLAIFTVILMATFGTKNVHSAMLVISPSHDFGDIPILVI